MWLEALDLLERADRLQRQCFGLGRRGARPTWEPPVDLLETSSELLALVALPGVAAESIEVAIDGAALVVGGERPLPREARTANIHRLEIPYGWFERRIELPAGRFELSEHELLNGCLILRLRKLR